MYAKSAATMLALSGNSLYLDQHSELGPIDPQFNFQGRGTASPAGGILSQFEEATRQIKDDPERLPAWVPILQQYAPSLLDDARQAWDLAKQMVEGWLTTYMFDDEADGPDKARIAATYFSGQDSDDRTVSHSRSIGIDKCGDLGLNVVDLRSDRDLHGRVRDVHHAVNITLAETGAYKIVENHKGEALVRALNVQPAGEAPPGQPVPGITLGGPGPARTAPPGSYSTR